MAETVKVYAILIAKPGCGEQLETLLRGMVGPSRSEEGNLRYDLWMDSARPGQFVLDELYLNDAGAASHRSSPHFQNYLSKVNDLAERTAILALPVDVGTLSRS